MRAARSRATRSQPPCVGGGWAGLLPPGSRTGACSYFPSPFVSVRVRSNPFLPRPYFCRSPAIASAPFHLSSFHHSSFASAKKNRLSRGRSGAGCADAYADDRPRMCVVRWRVCGRPTAHLRSVGPVGQVGRLFHLSCSLCAIKPRLSQWSYWPYPSYCAGFLSVVRNRISAISSFIFSSLIIRVSEKKPPVPRDRR